MSTCYVILVTLGASAKITLSMVPVDAHMTIRWFTQLATITPPVCLTTFAAANIAGASPMKTGYAALKLGLGFYYIPVLFIFTSLLTGSWSQHFAVRAAALLGIYLLVSALEGYMRKPLCLWERGLIFIGAICTFGATFTGVLSRARITLLALGISVFLFFYLQKAVAASAEAVSWTWKSCCLFGSSFC